MKQTFVLKLHGRNLAAAIPSSLVHYYYSCKKDNNLTKEVLAFTGSATKTDKQLISEAKSDFDKYVNTCPK